MHREHATKTDVRIIDFVDTSHPGRVFTRAQLLDSVWGFGHEGYEHTVNSHINRLRRKIEPVSDRPRYIVTVWGVGYKMQSGAESGT